MLLVIPAIDLRGGRCVRLHQGSYERETVYFDDPVRTTDRYGVEQLAHPRTMSMTVYDTKTGRTTKKVRDFRV